MGRENRKFLRRGIDRDVQIKLADGSIVRAALSDVWQGGACLKIRNSENLPAQFIIELSEQVHRWSRIVWRTAEKVGLEFIPSPQAAVGHAARQSVLIKCPRTGKLISTGMQLNIPDDLKGIAMCRRFSQCPYCKITHGWTPGEAFVMNLDVPAH
jgi:hypothetical protein